MNDEDVLLKKEIKEVSFRLFAKRKVIKISLTDGTSIKTSLRKLAKTFREKKVSDGNARLIRVAFSPIP
jgi:hypothetical protein